MGNPEAATAGSVRRIGGREAVPTGSVRGIGGPEPATAGTVRVSDCPTRPLVGIRKVALQCGHWAFFPFMPARTRQGRWQEAHDTVIVSPAGVVKTAAQCGHLAVLPSVWCGT
jgi:hypothetical protein